MAFIDTSTFLVVTPGPVYIIIKTINLCLSVRNVIVDCRKPGELSNASSASAHVMMVCRHRSVDTKCITTQYQYDSGHWK